MDVNEVRQWAASHRLPDSWFIQLENETEPRPEPVTLAEARGHLTSAWGVTILNVNQVDVKPQQSIKLTFSQPEKPKPAPVAAVQSQPAQKPILAAKPYNASTTATVIGVFGILLFLAGGLMAADGILAAVAESRLSEPSAIRGTENVLEYGLGFLILGMGLLLCGVSDLLRKP